MCLKRKALGLQAAIANSGVHLGGGTGKNAGVLARRQTALGGAPCIAHIDSYVKCIYDVGWYVLTAIALHVPLASVHHRQ